MSAIVMSIANQKGGVGKTTIATQFAFDLAIKHGQRVLYVDLLQVPRQRHYLMLTAKNLFLLTLLEALIFYRQKVIVV